MSGQRATPRRRSTGGEIAPPRGPPPTAACRAAAGRDLAKYERAGEPDDYRHRMLVNAAAFLFVLGLIGAGLWLAESMAELRRNQDCVLAGHRNCAPIEAVPQR